MIEWKENIVRLEFESDRTVRMARLEAEVLLLGLADLLGFTVWKIADVMDDSPIHPAEEQCD